MTTPHHAQEHKAQAQGELRHSWLHRFYLLSLLIKGINGTVETVAGVALFLMTADGILNSADWLLGLLGSGPEDVIGVRVMRMADHTAASREKLAVYILGHGVLKLFMVTGLLRKWMWAYPVAMAASAGFVGWMSWQLIHHFSWLVLGCALFDVLAFFLIWREWRKQRELRTLPD